MKYLLIFFLASLTIPCFAQEEIALEQIKDHIGDSVKIQGKIYGVRYLETSKNAPTFINVGAAYPNQLLTVVIWGDVRKKLGFIPEDKKYADGTVVVTGKLELYNNKPQIVIRNPDQLDILFNSVRITDIPPGQKANNK